MPVVDPITIDGVTLDRSWVEPTHSARLHLLPAFQAPVCVVIRRKPSRLFHVMKWDTRRDTFEHGSWFRGKLYPMRCDVSWDGRWMVYLAMGADGSTTWNGLCQPPWLKTIVESANTGTWAGGGVFTGAETLTANTCWYAEQSLTDGRRIPKLRIVERRNGGEDEGALHERLRRDGWERSGPNWGTGREIKTRRDRYTVANVGDDGWHWKPTRRHPTLRTWYRGYLERGRTFEFELEGYEQFVDARVEWATWDCKGDLLVARCGHLQRYSLSDLASGTPAFDWDLDSLAPTAHGDFLGEQEGSSPDA